MFNIDYIELDQIIHDWDERRGNQLNIHETVIDTNFLIIQDQTQKELIDDLKCCICLGLVRLPATMCN